MADANTERQLRQACAELERRLRQGDPCRAEDFFTAYPLLASGQDTALDLLYTEYLTRVRLARQALVEEFTRRFPDWGEAIHQQLQMDAWFNEFLFDDLPDELQAVEAGIVVAQQREEPQRNPLPSLLMANAETKAEIDCSSYEILEEVARGGMGVLYRARQVRLNRIVALKMILAGAHASPQARLRFRTEAEALARLQHPNIVQVYEVGELEDIPYLSLEYAGGGNLAQKMQNTPQAQDEAAALVETLALAAHTAHQAGIVHRDLKPANIVLTADGIPKITDFGLAKLLDDEATQTHSTQFLGTPSYMAPEQAASRQVPSPAVDIYALGAILYEMLTGRPVFKGETPLETLHQVQTEEPISPRRLQPTVARDLETICLKCLEKNPQQRYASALTLAEDLRRFLDGRPVQARPIGPLGRFGRWSRRKPILATPTLTLLTVLMAGFLGIVWQWQRAEQYRQQAEERFQLAHQTIATTIARSFENCQEDPEFRPVRDRLFTMFHDYYENLVLQMEENPGDLEELAVAQERRAFLLYHLGRREEAAAAYEQALPLWEKLAAEDPAGVVFYIAPSSGSSEWDRLKAKYHSHVSHRHNVAACYAKLASLHIEAGRVEEGTRYTQLARQCYKELIKEHPVDHYFRIQFALLLTHLGSLHWTASRQELALQVFEEVIPLWEQVPGRYTRKEFEPRIAKIGQQCLVLGQSEEKQSLLPQALRSYQCAVRAFDLLARTNTSQERYQIWQGSAHHHLGVVQLKQGHLISAWTSFQHALQVREVLGRTNPDNQQWQEDLQATRDRLAETSRLLEKAMGQHKNLPSVVHALRGSPD